MLGNSKLEYIRIAEMEKCEGMDHLERFFQDIVDRGGEGIILRDPSSPFQSGRSHGYLKHKVFILKFKLKGMEMFFSLFFLFKKYRDAEARIVRPVGTHQWECEL